jgi:hypothetical protein
LNVDRGTLFQIFKYIVYALLTFNIYLFFVEEHLAAQLQFPLGVALMELNEAYASTIDTAAWVILLLMFELETHVLEDHHFTKPVTWSLHGVRIFCYALILSAFQGYTANLAFAYDVTTLTNISDLCSIASDQWSYAVDIDEYVEITLSSCASFTESTQLFRFGELPAVVDASGLRDIQYLAWVDVINAGVWLLIVLILEVDVRLQEHGRYEGFALRASTALKFVLYSILLLAAIYWGFKGDFVDFWDAFLWLVAFFFIEMNVVEWRKEVAAEQASVADTQ